MKSKKLWYKYAILAAVMVVIAIIEGSVLIMGPTLESRGTEVAPESVGAMYYMLFAIFILLPALAWVYGITSYVFTKKILLPHFILFNVMTICLLVTGKGQNFSVWFFGCYIYCIFSSIIALFTMLVSRDMKSP